MRDDEVLAHVELWHGERSVKARALVDTGAIRSIMSKKVAEELGFTSYKKPVELGTAEEGGKIRLIGYCVVERAIFDGIEVPVGASLFEVAENLRREANLILGKDNIDLWNLKIERGKRPYISLDPLHFLIV